MISFRPMLPRDRQFVIQAWMESSRTSYCGGQIMMEDWPTIMRGQVGKVLDRPAQCIVAYDPDDDEPGIADLLGFIAYDRESFRLPFVYYVYVKQTYRRWGYGRKLFEAAGINPSAPFQYSGNTRKVRELERKIPLARWAPLLARFPLDAAKRHDAKET